jgi:hypothetical protein
MLGAAWMLRVAATIVVFAGAGAWAACSQGAAVTESSDVVEASADCPPSGVVRGPWAQKPTASSITLRWDACAESDLRAMVRIDDEEVEVAGTRTEAHVRTSFTGAAPADLPGTYWLHEVVVEGLRPGGCHTYSLAADPGREGRFCTSRRPGEPFVFWALGDTNPAIGPTEDIVEQLVAAPHDFTLHLGDIQYYTSEVESWSLWFLAMQPMLSAGGFAPSRGNHESELEHELEDYYLRLFADGGHDGTATWYRFQSGGVHFFALDSQEDLDIGSEQGGWLEASLAAASASEGYRGAVVFMHKPLLTLGFAPSSPQLRDHYGPIFARHGVRLVLAGHVHGYERFLTEEGIVWVTSGGGGGPLGDVNEKVAVRPEEVPLRVAAARAHHALRLEVGDDEIRGAAIDPGGLPIDTFSVALPPPAPAAPRPL